jgi:dienelactone hydrolase
MMAQGADRLEAALAAVGLAALRVQLPAPPRADVAERTVRDAIESLAQQCGQPGHRIAVLAEGAAANAAVLGAREAPQVRAFAFLSGRLGDAAKASLAEWRENPVNCLVSSEDKPALRDLTDVYFQSQHADTDIHVFERMGRGTEMIAAYRAQFPEREPLEGVLAEWLRRELAAVGRAREVSFKTEDGWKIFGNLLLPDLRPRKQAPGVILLHSGRSDRYVFTDLERFLIRAGIAVLNIDWRGRGKSINRGHYFDLSKEERANGQLDARAAINYLAARPEVDEARIGLVGIVHGAEHAVRGSIGDARVKALALLTGYVPAAERERDWLVSGKVHVCYVTCTGHRYVTKVMRSLYDAAPDKLGRFLLYPGGAIGYQLFDLHDSLEPTILAWLTEALSNGQQAS